MKRLNDSIDIRDINLPGTHDTMSHVSFGIGAVRTQTFSLSEQLLLGVRQTDIRLVCESDIMYAHHGIIYLGSDLDDIFEAFQSHMQNYPTEMISMHVQQEEASSECTKPFNEIFNDYILKYPDLFIKNTTIPGFELKDWRGKVMLIKNFDGWVSS